MNANEIMNKIEELKNDEAIYANKNVLDDMAMFIRTLNDLVAFKEHFMECYVERDNEFLTRDNEFLTFTDAYSTKALITAMRIMMDTIRYEPFIEDRFIGVNERLETFREYSKKELAQYEKMKSCFENKE